MTVRLRYNGVVSALGGSLSSGATSVTFAAALTHAGGTNVPTITGNQYLPLAILDASGVLSEIVHLTAYTAAATTGTIVRGREGTTGVSHASGDVIVQGPHVFDINKTQGPDSPPLVPNAKDDEFDGTSAVTWTSTPVAPTTFNIDTNVEDAGYVRSNGNGGDFVGKYQAVPGAYPFTVTVKTSANPRANTQEGLGLFLSPATPTGSSLVLWIGNLMSGGSRFVQRQLTHLNNSAFVSASTAAGLSPWVGPMYFRVVVSSATAVLTQVSVDGKLWVTLDAALNPGFTPGVMGFAMSENGTADFDGIIEFFRVT